MHIVDALIQYVLGIGQGLVSEFHFSAPRVEVGPRRMEHPENGEPNLLGSM